MLDSAQRKISLPLEFKATCKYERKYWSVSKSSFTLLEIYSSFFLLFQSASDHLPRVIVWPGSCNNSWRTLNDYFHTYPFLYAYFKVIKEPIYRRVDDMWGKIIGCISSNRSGYWLLEVLDELNKHLLSPFTYNIAQIVVFEGSVHLAGPRVKII